MSTALCCAELASREAFVGAFGIGVEDHYRIAHGLFALQDGVFLAAEVPADQMRPVDLHAFPSKGRNTPFSRWEFKGQMVAALVGGQEVYRLGESTLTWG